MAECHKRLSALKNIIKNKTSQKINKKDGLQQLPPGIVLCTHPHSENNPERKKICSKLH